MKKGIKQRISKILLWGGCFLVAVSLVYTAVNYPWTYLMQRYGGAVGEMPADPAPLRVPYTFPDPNEQAEPDLESLPVQGRGLALHRDRMDLTLLGTIKIPLLGVSENIVEGSDEELLFAVGHVKGTAMPGQSGNCVLAGHRDYIPMHPFMHLPKMKEGDTIWLEALGQTYQYEVFKTFTVTPDEVWAAQPQAGEETMLTLITCTPTPTYTHRFICWARLVSTDTQE